MKHEIAANLLKERISDLALYIGTREQEKNYLAEKLKAKTDEINGMIAEIAELEQSLQSLEKGKDA